MREIEEARKAQRLFALDSTGHGTRSGQFLDQMPAPSLESRLRHLPNISLYQKPLQDSSNGNFYFMADYDAADSGPVQ